MLRRALAEARDDRVPMLAQALAYSLFLAIPGGIGPREGVMLLMLTTLSLTTEKQAALVTVASRLWLTLLELVPGLLFLAFDRIRPSPPLDSRTDGASSAHRTDRGA